MIQIDGELSGDINIAGDLISPGGVEAGSVGAGGRITVAGASNAQIAIIEDLNGEVQIGSALTSGGSIHVGWSLAAPSQGGGGRIIVSGMCDGDITVGRQTDALTLIHLVGGLGSGATLEVNATEGVFNASGVIYVGPSLPPNPLNDITFDGKITVHDDGSGGGGDLRGAIVVIGCHATTDNLEICLEGGDGGENISIKQNGCTNQVGWSCPGIGL